MSSGYFQEGPRRADQRRDIRAVNDHQLTTATRNARTRERERVKRLTTLLHTTIVKEKDKKAEVKSETYITPASIGIEEDSGRVCLNAFADGVLPSGESGLEDSPAMVHPDISRALKEHQIIGARFIWSHISVGPDGFGCILADYMGLGKTLQLIAVLHTFMTMNHGIAAEGEKQILRGLVVAPVICVRNWRAEFHKWLGHETCKKMGLYILEAASDKTVEDRVKKLERWNRKGGVMLLGYEMYRSLMIKVSEEDDDKRKYRGENKHLYDRAAEYLSDPGPEIVVLDEGHRLRNRKSKIVQCFQHLKTTRRILLTGYPVQNHLEEYWCMVNFARPDFLGTHDEFRRRFADPIKNGQCKDSFPHDITLSRKRCFLLTQELTPLVLRRDQSYLHSKLPPKKEWVLQCKLSPLQCTLYREFLRYAAALNARKSDHRDKINVLEVFHLSLAVSNHPDIVHKTLFERDAEEKKRKEAEEASSGSETDEELKEVLNQIATLQEPPSVPGTISESDDDEVEITRVVSYDADHHRLTFAKPFLEGHIPGDIRHSGKMMILFEILQQCKLAGDRTIIFSQSLKTLDVIIDLIYQHNEVCASNSEKLPYRFLRIDGAVSQSCRFSLIEEFNDPRSVVDIMLVSTKAGGEGINLIGANRVVLFDVCWNPCHDNQAMCRAYRFGQVKPVHVYRLISACTLEKKVYHLQVRKEGVSKRIVDDTPLERRFNASDLTVMLDENQFRSEQRRVMIRDKGDDENEEEWTSRRKSPKADVKPSIEETKESKNDIGELLQSDFLGNVGEELPADMNRESVFQDPALSQVLRTSHQYLNDYYQQETMFEEDESELCSEVEKIEALAEYNREKAAEPSSEGIGNLDQKFLPDLSSLNAPLRTPIAGSKRALPLYYLPPRPQQYQRRRAPTPRRKSKVPIAPRGVGGSWYAPAPVMNSSVSKYRILLLRRGFPNSDEIRARAQALGIAFDIELTSHTTDIVSAQPVEKVLSWLQLQRFPPHVTFRTSNWLIQLLENTQPNRNKSVASASAAASSIIEIND